ncbi:S9 family peptidase [Nostoc ellipsosporum NOK]|nr:S9 family peptidase [Nostoc ellipsosporum NOK]
MRKLFVALLFLPLVGQAQKKAITLEDLYKKGTFRGEYVPADFGTSSPEINTDGLKDENGKALRRVSEVIVNAADTSLALIRVDAEAIYRHSSKAIIYLYHRGTGNVTKLENEKVLHPTFSPDGSKIAYVKANNLYIYDIASGQASAITTDGKWNFIINGNCDWVYEEEFSFTQAYQWSPKGNYLAYYRFDESQVKEYNMTIYNNGYNEDYRYKYPKAGDDNSKVEIHIYDVRTGKRVKADYEQGDIYIPRIKWTQDDSRLVVYWLNRHQDHLRLLLTEAASGKSSLLYEEKNKYYIDIHDDWYFLRDGKHFLFTSEKNGYNQIWLYSLDGKKQLQLSSGAYDVAEINGVDETNQRVYYTVAYPRPMDRNLFVADFSGKKNAALTTGEAWHRVVLNEKFTQFYDYKSDLNTPQVVTLQSIVAGKKGFSAKVVKTVNESSKLREKMAEYNLAKAEFIRIPNTKGDTLNSWMLKPANFDASRRYPVLFCNYGGPGSQQVANRFGAVSFWHQLLAQNGFIVVSVDNSGTGYRGEEFKKKTYLQLGKLEIEDQIDAARWLGNLPYVDKSRIGHWGWSFGGFMSSLAITKGADVFSAAIAVAPVTSWRFYDNIYTERYMRTPAENQKGYDDNAPLNFTSNIKGKFLIIHGTADDNVHFQNATQMITAMVKSNINFESAYYPNKNHGISGGPDNTSFHLWSKMTNWLLENLGKEKK